MAIMLIDKTIQIPSRKKRKIEEDNMYVLVNKHGHCDVHMLCMKSNMIEFYLLTYTQRNAFYNLPGLNYDHNYMKRKITNTNVHILLSLCFPKALTVLWSMYIHVILSTKKFSYA